MKKDLSKIPPWLFTILILMAILWLTLSPHPLGENPPEFFPGADKLAHAIMFGGLTLAMLFDLQRRNKWKEISATTVYLLAGCATIIGIVIEFAQAQMDMGRGMEYNDMISDGVGAFVIATVWLILQKNWCNSEGGEGEQE